MKIGVSSYIWAENFGLGHAGILPRLKEAGFDGIEIGILSPRTFPAAAIRKELERYGLESTVCSVIPHGMSLITEDAEARRKARSHVEDCLKATAEMGGTVLCGPLYSPVGFFTGKRRTADEWDRGVESWREIAEATAGSGVTVAIEPLNRFETYFLNTDADGAKFCDEVGHSKVGILVDTFHANIEEKSIGPALRQVGRHLKHVHSCENDRGTPGTGNVNWAEFFSTIAAIHYDGWFVIESFGFSLGGISAAASIWRDIERDPEDIAFNGVKYLRRMLSHKK
jgi:D-psicose/D-tagatose/L-ribulose 3-epimerase